MDKNSVKEAIRDISIKSKKGLAFILSAIILWTLITIVYSLNLGSTNFRNFLTFFCSPLLLPIALLFSKVIRAEFSIKNNTLSQLGFIFSMGQVFYFPIIMWLFFNNPEGFILALAIITGAHFFPFSWLYDSKAYQIMGIAIPIIISVVGWSLRPEQLFRIPLTMLILLIIFAIWLYQEVRKY